MYLLYLDDSGAAELGNGEYLVLGGVCLEERQIQHFTQELDKIANRLVPGCPESVEFHASVIFSAREEPWKSIRDRNQRRDIIREVLGVLSKSFETARAFATVVHKASVLKDGKHPMEVAFSDLCLRFDHFLHRVDSKGLLILDESAHATRLQKLSHDFRVWGTKMQGNRHIVDGPLFASSRAFRCIQMADHIAYAVYRRFEAKDATYFDVFAHRFDSEGRVVHGLGHWGADTSQCMCIACLSQR